jgi:hypothetical protein
MNKTSVIRLILIALSLLLISAVFYILIQHGEKQALKANQEQIRQDYEVINDSIHHQLEMMLNLIDADDFYFEGEMEESLSALKSLLMDSLNMKYPLRSKINLRIQVLNDFLVNPDTSDTRIRTLMMVITDKEKDFQALQIETDSLMQYMNKTISEYDEKISEMKATIREKDKKLTVQDRIRVISFTTSKGAKIHYLGEVDDNKANGGGVGIWSTGSLYRGQWKDNLRHGKGHYEWPNGHIYDGEYLNDKREGQGVYLWPSGEKYDGEWKDDKRNGFGTLYDMDGNIQFEGQWENDKIKN